MMSIKRGEFNMTIQRSPHDKVNPYVMVNKELLKDPDLSWGAKGLLSYLLSLPSDWKVQVSHLSKIYEGKGGGEKAIYSLLHELIAAGYCERIQTKNENGHFISTDYHITEFKKTLPLRLERDAVELLAVERLAVEGDTTNKEVIQKNKTTTTTKEEPLSTLPSYEKPKIKQHPPIESSYDKQVKCHFYEFTKKHNLSWKIRDAVIFHLSKEYNEKYVTDQINYMCNQQEQAIRDALVPTKKHPKKFIENAESFLQLACKENWALSTHTDQE